MSFDSSWTSGLRAAEYMGIEPSTHSNGAEVGRFNMQPGYGWASTHLSSSSISISHYHSCRPIVCVNPILDLGELQRDNIAQMQVLHMHRRQGPMEYMRPGGLILPPPPTEPRRLRTSQVSIPGNPSYTENSRSPPTGDYGSNDTSLQRISLHEGVPTLVNTPPSFSTFVQDGKKRYRCECGTETAREADMKRHHKYALNHSQPQFGCDQCGKPFTRKDSCDTHKKTCLGIRRNELST